MEIIDNRAIKLRVRKPERITSVIPKSKIIAEDNGIYDVLVHWGYDEVIVLKNLGIKDVPSPIFKTPKWPGLYEPFEHQKTTASFLTLNKHAYCLNEQGCVDSETEYLSPTGWVKISEYLGGQVAQYHPDTKTTEFVDPIEYVKLPCDVMVHFKGEGYDQMLSPEHRVLTYNKDEEWEVNSAYELHWRQKISHITQIWKDNYVWNGDEYVAFLTDDYSYLKESTDGFKYCFMVPSTFLLFRRNGCVFASGNTGKTNAILWATDYLMNQGYVSRALIICPLSIMRSTWQSDAFKTVTHRSIDVAHGNRTARAKVIESDASIVVINFDGVEIVLDELHRGKFDLIVIDEANFVKNAQSKRWKAINSLISSKTWLWMATGTPASQSPMDAYGLAKMMNPESVPKFAGGFRDEVMNKITQFRYVPKPNAADKVHKLLQPAIRFTKEECMDLPEMLYATREVPMTAQQAKYYKILKEQMRVEAAGEEITTVNAAVNLNKLLQVASGSVYSDNKEVVEFDASNRLNELVEIIEESSHKVLVFAAFRHGIEMISKHLISKGLTVDVIHGGVSANKRTEIFDKFQTTPDPHVLVIQPQSASHGVTLTAANTVVWWGPVTSYETYVQANARVHRAGQKNPSLVVHLTGSPVEKKLYTALQTKEKMQDTLMSLYADEINS